MVPVAAAGRCWEKSGVQGCVRPEPCECLVTMAPKEHYSDRPRRTAVPRGLQGGDPGVEPSMGTREARTSARDPRGGRDVELARVTRYTWGSEGLGDLNQAVRGGGHRAGLDDPTGPALMTPQVLIPQGLQSVLPLEPEPGFSGALQKLWQSPLPTMGAGELGVNPWTVG